MRSTLSGFCLAFLMTAATTAGAAPGDLDPGFATGIHVHGLGDLRLFPQADGRVLLADRGSGLGGDGRPNLVALGRDGQLDASFGEAGTLALSVPSASEWIEVLSIAPDGKVLATVAESTRNSILRLNKDGTPDTSFGVGGRLVLNERRGFDPWDVGTLVKQIAVRADGRMLVLELPSDCSGWDGCGYPGGPGFLRQINADGSLDVGYGVGGLVEIPGFSPWQRIESLPLLADGALVIGDTNGELRIVSSDGRHVRSVSTGNRMDAITELPDGRLLAAMVTGGLELHLLRMFPDGSPDRQFGGGTGRAVIPFNLRLYGSRSITADAAGRIYVALYAEGLSGAPGPSMGAAILRLLPTGELDPEFGVEGLSLLSNNFLVNLGVVLDHDDRPLVHGSGQVVRLSVDDTTGPGILSMRSSFGSNLQEVAADVRLVVSRLAGSRGAAGVRVRVAEPEQWKSPKQVAVEGKDFVLSTSRLDWADGDASDKSILIRILEDEDPEEFESFQVELVDHTGGALSFGSPRSSLSISANDGAEKPAASSPVPVGIVNDAAAGSKLPPAGTTGSDQPDSGGGSLEPVAIGLLLVLWAATRQRRRWRWRC